MKKILLSALLSSLLFLPLAGVDAGIYMTVDSTQYYCTQTAPTDSQVYEAGDLGVYDAYKGRIIIRTGARGQAYYVGTDKKIYYLGSRDNFISRLQSLGLGITDYNLKKIKAGVLDMYGTDSDKDGLSDEFEKAIGADMRNFNTDNDRYSDYTEIVNGYDPNGPGRLPISSSFSNGLKGRVLIQTENNGYAWYVNPADSKRYFLNSKWDGIDIVTKLGLGISEYQFDRLIR